MATGTVEIGRVLPIITEYIENNHYYYNGSTPVGGRKKLAYATGITERLIYDIMSGRRKKLDPNTVDMILSGLDLTHLTYWEKEEGGFKDVFDNLKPVDKARQAIDQRARRKKRKDRRIPCECGKMKHYRSAKCNRCYRDAKRQAARKCADCGKVLYGGRRSTETIRCWPCWDKFRKSEYIAGKQQRGYKERRDGHARVLRRQPLSRQTEA